MSRKIEWEMCSHWYFHTDMRTDDRLAGQRCYGCRGCFGNNNPELFTTVASRRFEKDQEINLELLLSILFQ
jgi:hypothetical protein